MYTFGKETLMSNGLTHVGDLKDLQEIRGRFPTDPPPPQNGEGVDDIVPPPSEISWDSVRETELTKLETRKQVQERITAYLRLMQEAEERMKDPVLREQARAEIRKTQEVLHGALRHSRQEIRQGALTALYLSRFERKYSSRTKVEEMLQKMVADGHLAQASGEALISLSARKGYNPPVPLTEEEEREVRDFFKKLLTDTVSREYDTWEKTLRQLQDDYGVISVTDLSPATQSGACEFSFPEGRDPKGRVLFGGRLMVYSEGGKIFPVAAQGACRAAIAEAAKEKFFLLAYTLEWKGLPPPDALKKKNLTDQQIRRIYLVWNLLKRGMEWEKYRQEALKGSSLNAPQFCEGQVGTVLVELQQAWEPKESDKKWYNVAFPAERLIEAGIRLIRVPNVPPHLQEFLGECVGTHPEGEKYEGLPDPLRQILRAHHRQVTDGENGQAVA